MKRRRRKFSCVYVLQSLLTGSIYVGFTDNLRRRLREHQDGLCYSTAKIRPLELIGMEYFLCKSDALRREGYLKTPEGKRSLLSSYAEALCIGERKREEIRLRAMDRGF